MTDSAFLQELDKAGAEGLRKAASFLEAAGDFTAEQAPIVVREIINRAALDSALDVVICAVALPFLWKLYNYAVKRLSQENAKDYLASSDGVQMGCGVLAVGSVTGGILAIMILVLSLKKAARIAVAPRLYVIEQVGELLNVTKGNK